jgi:hypothetical protein
MIEYQHAAVAADVVVNRNAVPAATSGADSAEAHQEFGVVHASDVLAWRRHGVAADWVDLIRHNAGRRRPRADTDDRVMAWREPKGPNANPE